MRPISVSLAGALAVVLFGSVAAADDTPDPVRAAALFAEGRQLMAGGDYAAACPKLAESQALDPEADTALDLGICYQNASQAAFKVAHELAGAPDGTGAPAIPSRALVPDAQAPAPGQAQRIAGVTLGAAGVIGVVAGVIASFVAKRDSDAMSSCVNAECTASGLAQHESAVDLARVATISLVAGAAALGGGAIVFFTAPRPRASPAPTVGLGPAAQGAGLAIDTRF
jgi:hypothetical protein